MSSLSFLRSLLVLEDSGDFSRRCGLRDLLRFRRFGDRLLLRFSRFSLVSRFELRFLRSGVGDRSFVGGLRVSRF